MGAEDQTSMTKEELFGADLAEAFSFDAPRKKEISREEVRRSMLNICRITNQQWGNLDRDDGYNCPICRNKGEIFKVFTTEGATDKNGDPISPFNYDFTKTVPCSCMEKRRRYERSRMSGLPEGYTFDTFKVDEGWQEDMRALCQRYLTDRAWKDGAWLYMGGAIGSGKSHIVSALARELVYEKNVSYMNWVREARQLKSVVNDNLDYGLLFRRFAYADILFIDDFFKSGYVTEADKRLAYDILNERYNNRKPTLFTSEMFIDEIPDEAINGRIYERAKDYTLEIGRDRDKDMRRR